MLLFKLAWRNLWRSRKRSLITMSSVFFAVLLAVLAESVNRGSHEGMIRNSVSYFTGYLQLQDSAYMEEPSLDYCFDWDEQQQAAFAAVPGVASLVPRVQGFVLAASNIKTRGAMVLGVDPAREEALNGLQSQLLAGGFEAGGVVVADRLAERLGIKLGDTLVVLGQGYQGQQAAGAYRVTGLVKPKLPELRKQTAYLLLPDAQTLFAAEGMVSSVLVMPQENASISSMQKQMQSLLPTDGYVVVRNWEELLPELLAAIEFDNASNRIILVILYIVIGFGIFGTVLTMTLERRKEFGVLISVGMRRGRLALMTFYETLLLGGMGVLAGLAGSLPIVAWFYAHPVPLSAELGQMSEDFGVDPFVYFSADPSIFGSQAAVVLAMCALVALYPVLYVKKLNVLQASRA
jgi:ABC-type lipoprotein release transport system permease subunit